jgi:hypothetical protein
VLRHCIASVLQSSHAGWELIVVGDGCTDETEDTVRSFADPRIRFINLPTNSGGQAAPNNAGLELARGQYVYFLNHDDLFFPDHLGQSIAFMETTQADVSWSPVFLLQGSAVESGPPIPGCDVVSLDGAGVHGSLDSRSFMIASSWAVRRDVFRDVGPWCAESKTRLSPSQEWLFRAHRRQCKFVYNPHVSVLCIHAGSRRHSYIVGRSPENDRAFTWAAAGEPARTALLECAAVEQASRLVKCQWEARRFETLGVSRGWRVLAVEGLRRIGFHPVAVARLLAGEGKGDWIARVRRFTGEAPELHPGETMQACVPLAEPFFGRGWHPAEAEGRWTRGGAADFVFSLPADAAVKWVLELCGRSLRLPDQVSFNLNGRPLLTTTIKDGPTVTRLPIIGRGGFWLSITAQSPATPHDVFGADDVRMLGFQLLWFRLVAAHDAQASESPRVTTS